MTSITLVPLAPNDRERFILDNQEAFNYGALQEFGRRDDHFEEDGEIISRETIVASINGGEAYRIMLRKAVKPKLLRVFITICTAGIILVGYSFNVLQSLFV